MNVELSSTKFYEEAKKEAQSCPEKRALLAPRRQTWAGGLTPICLVCGLFGLWGLGTSAVGIASTLAGPSENAMQAARQQGFHAVQMQKKIEKIQVRYVVPQLFLMLVRAGVAVALLMSSILLAMKSITARSFVVNTCYSAIVYQVLSSAFGLVMFISISRVMKEAVQIQAGGRNVDGIMSMVSFGGVFVSLAGLVICGGIYAAMAIYLNTPMVRAIFGENPYPESDDMQARAAQGLDAGLV